MSTKIKIIFYTKIKFYKCPNILAKRAVNINPYLMLRFRRHSKASFIETPSSSPTTSEAALESKNIISSK